MHQPQLIEDEQSNETLDDAQKAHYRERLREMLANDAAFRQIEGFPIGTDEAILNLSDPPYYTACPNPFLDEILAQWQTERAELRERLGLPEDAAYSREPFAADVSEGKNNPIYNAHSYHTKVPHRAIMRYILHYTDPGDVVFDGFCGTGMTGVAAQLCGDRQEVEALGFRVDGDGVIYEGDKALSRLGARKAILNDLSPAATFIAHNYNTPVDVAAFEREATRILKEVEDEYGWMYETWHPRCDAPNRQLGNILYTIWSDVFLCPECNSEILFWEGAINRELGKIVDEIKCKTCKGDFEKRDLDRAKEYTIDKTTSKVIQIAKQVPVQHIVEVNGKRFRKKSDRFDRSIIERVKKSTIPFHFPRKRIDKDIDLWYERDYVSLGVYSTDAFFTDRNLQIAAGLWHKLNASKISSVKFPFTAIVRDISKLTGVDVKKYFKGGGGPFAGGVKGTLYIPSLTVEKNIFFAFRNRLRRQKKLFQKTINGDHPSIVTTQPLQRISYLRPNTIDYIFTDPPFGSNFIYSDLSILWEDWIGVSTATTKEAVIHRRKKKNATDLAQYGRMMFLAFSEAYRVLKPACWITVEFHNTKSSVWNVIQETMSQSGFIVADVRTLDKKQGSFKQVNARGAVKQDLVISAYKPHDEFVARFAEEAGTEEGAWEFVRQHLVQLPIVVSNEGVIEPLSERQDYLLFDRMVAFHLQRGATVPLSASEFYAGLRQRFAERDSMFFLSEQIPEYERARLQADRVAQLSLFVTDEKSSIQWLRQQLGGHPQTYQQIQPQFLKQLHQQKHEALPELSDLLNQSFLQDDDGRWYVPDPDKASDLEKLRHKALLREFEGYRTGRKKLKAFRTEAVRAGFMQAYRDKRFDLILQVAARLPQKALHEDQDLLTFYDIARTRVD